jgi:hypothetical protein
MIVTTYFQFDGAPSESVAGTKIFNTHFSEDQLVGYEKAYKAEMVDADSDTPNCDDDWVCMRVYMHLSYPDIDSSSPEGAAIVEDLEPKMEELAEKIGASYADLYDVQEDESVA